MAKIVPTVKPSRAGTPSGHDATILVADWNALEACGTRKFKIAQAADVENGHAQIERRLGIGSKEGSRLTGMRINTQGQVERLFDIGHRAAHAKQNAVGMPGRDLQ